MGHKQIKVCVPCRDRKRKCDRTTPSCSLCYRLGRVCHYGGLDASSSSSGSTPSQRSSIVKSYSPRISSPEFTIPSVLNLNDGKLMQSSINGALSAQLSKAVGDVADIRDVATKYFGTTHLWYPIISETLYYQRLLNTFTIPRADHSLLSLSMALINTIPSDGEKLNEVSSLYVLIKSSIAIVEAANINSLQVVQARLLVSLYEVGHGISAAYISIAATARAAVLIGINRMTHDTYASKTEEGLRVWWGIVMLDRYYSLERGEGPCATQELGSPSYLPKYGNLQDEETLSSKEPLSLSTPSTIRVGPFARQAQVSHVLDLLLLHLRDQKMQQVLDVQESDQLARTLLAFSRLLPEESPAPWPRYCGAIGMCYGALMVLHESRENYSDESVTYSTEFLQTSLEGITWIAGRFNLKINQVDIEAVSPFPSHAIYMAALQQDRIWRETGDLKCFEAANTLAVMLRHFGRRWSKARKLLRLFEEQRHKIEQVSLIC